MNEAAAAVHLPEGAVFYREGEESRHFALVARGDIRVFRTASNGREMTLYHVRDGQPCLIALLCAVLGRRAMATAVVEEPTDAILVPADVFRKLLTTNGALQLFVFEMMAARVVDMLTLVEEITVRRIRRRPRPPCSCPPSTRRSPRRCWAAPVPAPVALVFTTLVPSPDVDVTGLVIYFSVATAVLRGTPLWRAAGARARALSA